jgi:formamidopyrimidine-DNA glycosylase
MPELPEAEVVRRGLAAAIVGRTVRMVEAPPGRVVRRNASPNALAEALTSRVVTAVDRVGKFLVLRVDGPTAVIVHLGMSGQISIGRPGAARPRHTHVVVGFADGDEWRFVDPRTFGHVFVSDVGPDGRPCELVHLGVDPLESRFTLGYLAALAAGREARVKLFLMDQRRIAGLGNIYSDEILWRARVRWDRPVGSLDRRELGAVRRATVSILTDAIAAGGSSLSDGQYVDVDGASGRYQDQHRVYARTGQPCPRCRTPIVRERFGGRSTFSCPSCQAIGPVDGP